MSLIATVEFLACREILTKNVVATEKLTPDRIRTCVSQLAKSSVLTTTPQEFANTVR